MATHPVHYASLTKTHDGPPCTPTLASAVPMNGYFLPAEGASDKALALFSFSSLAAYEQYRALFGTDPDFIEADRIRDDSGCVLRYERTFMRPGFAAFGHAAITSLVMLSWQNSRRGGEKLRGGDVIDLGCRVGRHDCAGATCFAALRCARAVAGSIRKLVPVLWSLSGLAVAEGCAAWVVTQARAACCLQVFPPGGLAYRGVHGCGTWPNGMASMVVLAVARCGRRDQLFPLFCSAST